MSGYYYPPRTSAAEDDDDFDFETYTTLPPQAPLPYTTYPAQNFPSVAASTPFYGQPQQYIPQPLQYQQQSAQYPLAQQYPPQWAYGSPSMSQQPWMPPTVPSNVPYQQQPMSAFPQYSEPTTLNYTTSNLPTTGPSRRSTGYLSPDSEPTRVSRAASFASNASSNVSYSDTDVSRSASPSAAEMMKWGRRLDNGTWRCAYPGCSSLSRFNRGCDLRKHYKRHTKTLFCRHKDCEQSREGGFSSKKDRDRHEAKHDPQIPCEWPGCSRVFSRVDNMKDHVKRMHQKRQR